MSRKKADPGDSSHVGAPMSGVVVELRVHEGTDVKKGDPVAVLSAMKMVSPSHHHHFTPQIDRAATNTRCHTGNGHQRTAFRKGWRATGPRGRFSRWTRFDLPNREGLSGFKCGVARRVVFGAGLEMKYALDGFIGNCYSFGWV